ncbi:MAG: MBL fold metallo-hydrolase [Acidobacteriota bacterium]|nr:MBL fold metallo-hydrolase [Acidobacteriota bacterium]
MKITVFQSDKGDCLLIEGNDGKRVLVDGGMPDSYSHHVAPYLNNLQQNGDNLDVVYVSHIDEDHISGILQMMDDAVAWRIYDYQTTDGGNPSYPEPKVPRPPAVDRVWHNAFHELVGDNEGKIEDMLAATTAVLAGGEAQKYIRMAQFHQNVATSIRQAINLSRRLGEKQLDIRLNPEAKGKLMMLRRKQNGKPETPISIGGMNWSIIGPFSSDLEKLKDEWNTWLKKNEKTLARVEVNSRRDERRIGNSLPNEINRIVSVAASQAEQLAFNLLSELDLKAPKVLGNRQKVTVPNLASLMFLVEEKSANGKVKTLLLTGDGHHKDILNGLEYQRKLKTGEPLFVDVLKIQHHGSEHNLDLKFCQRVIADHYIFCGNGAHQNPDLDVVEAVIDSRIAGEHQGTHPQVGKPFKLWFNSSSTNTETEPENAAHMKKVEDLVTTAAEKSNGKLEHFFLKDSFFEIDTL